MGSLSAFLFRNQHKKPLYALGSKSNLFSAQSFPKCACFNNKYAYNINSNNIIMNDVYDVDDDIDEVDV